MLKRSILAVLCGLVAASAPAQEKVSGNGLAYLIVFPDYPIRISGFESRSLGHAGVLLISKTGLTKYYEYGRYSPEGKKGLARKSVKRLSNVQMADGKPTIKSLKTVMREISALPSAVSKDLKPMDIRAAQFLHVDFDKMKAFAETWIQWTTKSHPQYSSKRTLYAPTSWNCGHFAVAVLSQGNSRIDHPKILDPRPRNFVDEYIEEKNAEVLYSVKSDKLTVGKGDESDAKK
ncbi:MAG: hypothetical protein AB8H80_13710 [Planctomycetota bacterium]